MIHTSLISFCCFDCRGEKEREKEEKGPLCWWCGWANQKRGGNKKGGDGWGRSSKKACKSNGLIQWNNTRSPAKVAMLVLMRICSFFSLQTIGYLVDDGDAFFLLVGQLEWDWTEPMTARNNTGGTFVVICSLIGMKSHHWKRKTEEKRLHCCQFQENGNYWIRKNISEWKRVMCNCV